MKTHSASSIRVPRQLGRYSHKLQLPVAPWRVQTGQSALAVTKASNTNMMPSTTHAARAVLGGTAGACTLVQAGCILVTAYSSLQLILLAREHHLAAYEQSHNTASTSGLHSSHHQHAVEPSPIQTALPHLVTASLHQWTPSAPQTVMEGAPYLLAQSAAVSMLLVAGAIKHATLTLSRWMSHTAAAAPDATTGDTAALAPTAALQAVQAAQVLQDGRMADIEKLVTKLQLTSRLYQADLGRPLKQVQEGMAQQAALTSQLATAQEGLKQQVLDTQQLLVATQATSAKQFQVLVKALEQVQQQQAQLRKQATRAAAVLAALQQQVPHASVSAGQQLPGGGSGLTEKPAITTSAHKQGGWHIAPPPDPWQHVGGSSGAKAKVASSVCQSVAGTSHSSTSGNHSNGNRKQAGSTSTAKVVQSLSSKLTSVEAVLQRGMSSNSVDQAAEGSSKAVSSVGSTGVYDEVQASLAAAESLASKVAAAAAAAGQAQSQARAAASPDIAASSSAVAASTSADKAQAAVTSTTDNITQADVTPIQPDSAAADVAQSGDSSGSSSNSALRATRDAVDDAVHEPAANAAHTAMDPVQQLHANTATDGTPTEGARRLSAGPSSALNGEAASAGQQSITKLTAAVDQLVQEAGTSSDIDTDALPPAASAIVHNSSPSSKSSKEGITSAAEPTENSSSSRSDQEGMMSVEEASSGQNGPWQVLVDADIATTGANEQPEQAKQPANESTATVLSGDTGKQYVLEQRRIHSHVAVNDESRGASEGRQAGAVHAGLQALQQPGITQLQATAPVMGKVPSVTAAVTGTATSRSTAASQGSAALLSSSRGIGVGSSSSACASNTNTQGTRTAKIAWEVVTAQGGRLMALQYTEASL